jgi:hypothetical protein
MPFRLTPPTQITLLVSVLLAVAALIIRYSGIEVPAILNHSFGILFLGYIVLLIGNLVEGA